MTDTFLIALYLIPFAAIFFFYLRWRSRTERKNLALMRESVESGLTEPASLHPVIDEVNCIGCAACVDACPEGDVIGLVHGKGRLVNPSHCIGHGACKAACPVDAITLVFGTEKRGVDIPMVKPNFETNVPGIFIAGELGGMGLIGNAVEQGRQAMEAIHAKVSGKSGPDLDVVIVGAGPAGISATLGAAAHDLRYVTVDQETMGGTVAHFPRGKIVMTRPVHLPIIGAVKLSETTKEALMELWQGIVEKTGIRMSYQERVETVTPITNGFEVKTSKATYQTKTVLLAIGRRGTPRKLGVAGEDQPKVVYRLIDPEQYRNQHVLVVGGGDSALEAAWSIAEVEGTTVTLSYRGEGFSRSKPKNRDKMQSAAEAGGLKVMLKSNVQNIGERTVTMEQEGTVSEMPNDAVIVCAGGVLPTPFLKEIGISVETKYGTA